MRFSLHLPSFANQTAHIISNIFGHQTPANGLVLGAPIPHGQPARPLLSAPAPASFRRLFHSPFAGLLALGLTALAPRLVLAQTTQTFTFTGAVQTFTVPAGVTSLKVVANGANGGNSNGGKGGKVQADLAVVAGQVLNIYVGGNGTAAGDAGYNGGAIASARGGGGGATDIRIGGIGFTN